MNVARLVTVVGLVLLASHGKRHFRRLLNPVTALCGPMAAALVVQQLIIPSTPFSIRAAGILIGACGSLSIGASISSVAAANSFTIRLRGGRTGGRLLAAAIVAFSMLAFFGAAFVNRAYEGAGAQLAGGLFARELAVANLAGTTQGLIVRLITAFTILTAVAVALLWLSRHPLRYVALGIYGIAVMRFTLAVRARLSAVLIVLIVGLMIMLAQNITRRRQTAVRSIVLVAGGLVAISALFSEVSYARTGQRTGALNFAYSTAGGPSALSVALADPTRVVVIDGRGQSVAGLLALTGSRGRTLGSFTPVPLDPRVRASNINIYTGFFALIQDYGTPVTFGIMGALGFLSAAGYRRLQRKPSVGMLVVQATLFLFLVCMPVAPVSAYNFWWLLLASPLILNRLFLMEISSAPRRPSLDGGTTVLVPAKLRDRHRRVIESF